MFGWNKTKKHNQNSPTNQKVHREFNASFPFRNLATKCDFTTQDGAVLEGTQPLEFLRSHPMGSGGRPAGHGQVNSWLLGRMSDCALSILQDSTEPSSTPSTGWTAGAESTKHRELECDCKEPGHCAFSWVTNLGLRKGKEKQPYWEEELAEPLKWNGKRTFLSPYLGNRNGFQGFLKPKGEKRSRSGSDCGHWERDDKY